NNEVPRTHKCLNDLQQTEISEYAQQNPNTKYYEIVQEFMKRYAGLKLDCSTISKVLKNCEQYKNIKNKSVAKKLVLS
ncbi:7279_t:CDS:1, partial [Gigaspora rosea]